MSRSTCTPSHPVVTRSILALSVTAAVLFSVACGTNGAARTPVGVGQGNFDNASLNGSYVYQISGTDFTSGTGGFPYREAGIFVANGAGGITAGVDDFCEGNVCQSNSVVTGSYSVGSDGTGTISLNSAAGVINLSIGMISSGKVYVVEADATLSAFGLAEQQSAASASATAAPSGTFAFRMHTLNSTSSTAAFAATVGNLTITNGAVSGEEDTLQGATFDNGGSSPLAITGALNAPVSGRGTGSVNNGINTSDFVYYLVDGNNICFLSSDAGIGVLGLGRAEMQTGPFSLSGGYAFGSRGDDDTSGLAAVNTVGAFTASKGTISNGSFDSVRDAGNLQTVSFTGTYTVASNGRAVVTLNPQSQSPIQQVYWMVSPSRAFFLTDDPTKVEDGVVDAQTGGPFSNGTLNGQYAFVMDGSEVTSNGGVPIDRVGWIQWNGSSSLNWNEFVNNGGGQQPGILPGNYSVSSNGRATASVNNLSSNIIGYIVSSNKAYLLQGDPGAEVIGAMQLQ